MAEADAGEECCRRIVARPTAWPCLPADAAAPGPLSERVTWNIFRLPRLVGVAFAARHESSSDSPDAQGIPAAATRMKDGTTGRILDVDYAVIRDPGRSLSTRDLHGRRSP